MPVTRYDKTIGRVTGWFDSATEAMSDSYQSILRWALIHKLKTLALALGIFILSIFMVPLLGTEFVPKADFSETSLNFYTPVGSSLEATEAKARQVDAILRDEILKALDNVSGDHKVMLKLFRRLAPGRHPEAEMSRLRAASAKTTVFPHPTLSEMMHESVLAAYGRALHI